MKFILFLLVLAAITAGSAFFVAPEFRGFHEGRLTGLVSQQLGHAGYEDFDLKMNHLHVEEITIRMIPDADDTKQNVTDDVVQIIKGVYGATTHSKAVHVEFEFTKEESTTASEEPQQIDADLQQNPEMATNLIPEQNPELTAKADTEATPEPEPVPVKPERESSEISVEWNEQKNEIWIAGKLSNASHKEAITGMVNKQFKPAAITLNLEEDSETIAESGKVLEIKNYLATIIEASVGKGSVKIVDDPATVSLSGTLKSKAEFELLEAELKPLLESSVGEQILVVNQFKYQPEFTIEKDDKQRAVILSGYASRNDSVNLSSYIKRYTHDKALQYEFKSEIIPDEHCNGYGWTAADQKLLEDHLKKAVRGKIFYENDVVSKVTGLTADQAYEQSLVEKFANTDTKIELSYDKDAKEQAPEVPPMVVSAAEKQHAAARKLRSELKEYKIYFASGQKDPAAKYDPMVKEIATIILQSEDKQSVIVIGGFADHTGDAASNEKLSKERAGSVQAKLVELGVPINRTVVEFFGAEGADADKKLSRRVEIRVR